MDSTDTLPIFLVEDSEDDLFFFKRLAKKASLNGPLAVATDGQQAIHMLEEAVKRGASAIPRLVLLDLKLPLRSGFEVLEWIRAQAVLARTPVVILSSSAEARDVEKAYQNGAQGYLVKYPEPAVLQEVVQKIAQLPPTAPLDSLVLPGLKRA